MDLLHALIGSDADTITWWQMCIRGGFIFIAALALVRAGYRRAFGRHTGFDIVLAVILGSVLSRALTANAPFIPSIAASATLVLLHSLMTRFVYSHHWFGFLVKGRRVDLIRNGRAIPENLKKTEITERDLAEAMRSEGGPTSFEDVELACAERSGDISIVPRGKA